MRIGYFSPFNPIRSGISDFSEELVEALRPYVDIEIFCDEVPENQAIVKGFVCRNTKDIENDEIRENLDLLVYHVGNNVNHHKSIVDTFMKYPGVLELHDFSLHVYLALCTYIKGDIDGYLKVIQYCHGERGLRIAQDFLDGRTRAPWEIHSLELTANKHLLDRASAIIVHSDMAKQMVKAIEPGKPVECILLHSAKILLDPVSNKSKCREHLGIRPDTLVFGSFGYATSSKRILQILEALALYKNEKKPFHYYVVGKIDGIDAQKRIRELGLTKDVTITGFTDPGDYRAYMGACDVCINLRYPTQGESSASLHGIMGQGKPVIVTDIGTFQEYPDDFVLKVRHDEHEIEDIYLALKKATESDEAMLSMGELAYTFAMKNCDLAENARKYARFFECVRNSEWHDTWLDSLVDKLEELKLTEPRQVHDYVSQLSENAQKEDET